MADRIQKLLKNRAYAQVNLVDRSQDAVVLMLQQLDLEIDVLILDVVHLGKVIIDAFFSHATSGEALIIGTPVLKSYWESKLKQFHVRGRVCAIDELDELCLDMGFIGKLNRVYIDDAPLLKSVDEEELMRFFTCISSFKLVSIGLQDEKTEPIRHKLMDINYSKQNTESFQEIDKRDSQDQKITQPLLTKGQMIISVNLLGKPIVHLDEKFIQFKYQKAEAIFYYLSINQPVERQRIMGIFWPEESEDKARKNLRNALYSIRQAFDQIIISNIGQRLIGFAEGVELRTNWNCILLEGEEESCEFLENFSLKGTPDFDLWVNQMREEVRGQKLVQLRKRISQISKIDPAIEGLAKAILKLDPFDEESCRYLMHHYIETGQQGKCMDVYSRICKVLEDELSIKPEQETIQLFKQVVESRKIQVVQGTKRTEFFYGRVAEMDQMDRFIVEKRLEGTTGLILVSGEAGIGKSTIIRRLIDKEILVDALRIKITCHEGDEHHFMKSWYPVILKIGEILIQKGVIISSHQKEVISKVFPTFMHASITGVKPLMEKQDQIPLIVIIQIIIEVVSKALEHCNLLLIIEDLQWMDHWGLELLKKIILDIKSKDLLIIGSFRSASSKPVELFSTELERQDGMLNIRLERFTRKETDLFIQYFPDKPVLSADNRAIIYKESDGNALILTEILKSIIENGDYNQIPNKVKTLFSGRCNSLSQQAKKLADLISAFFEPAKWKDIRHLSHLSDVELIDVLEELIDLEFIRESEIENGEIQYEFTHHKLKEFIYNHQSVSKRKLLHKRIGDYYRNQLTGGVKDRLLYPRLVQHYECSGDRTAYLAYRIRRLYDYLEISHELFPMIKHRILYNSTDAQQISEDYVLKEIASIGKMMETISHDTTTVRLELEYLNMVGRYEIVYGDVKQGCSYIQNMLKLAESEGYTEFVFKGYMQLIFNTINLRDIPEMDRLIKLVLKKIKNTASKGEMGVLIRLKGYLMILKNDFEKGESLFLSAIQIFEKPEYREIYALNRVAAIYHMGESSRLQNDYSSAMKWYMEAEGLCRDQGFTSHLALILAAMGITAYDNGRFDSASDWLGQAVKLYDNLHFKWGQIAAYAYWALISFRQGNHLECLKSLKKADRLTLVFHHVYETGLMLRIKAEICCLTKDLDSYKLLESYLELPDKSYCRDARKYFEEHPSFTYEQKVLSDLNHICGKCVLYQ